MKTALRFGPAGMPLACRGKKLAQGIAYCADHKLGAFEVEFVRGVRIRKEDAVEASAAAKQRDVLLSCHGPYWINCCSPLKEKQATTVRNIIQTARAAQLLGARTIVFHPGFYQTQSKEVAASNALALLREVAKKIRKERLRVFLGPETTGKSSQYGSLDEVLDLCRKLGTSIARPVIDFAHVHAREKGWIKTKEDYAEIIGKIKKKLGSSVLKQLHCHFTEVEFSEKGERYHLNVGSKNSPPFRPLAQLLVEKKYKFTVISESPLLDKDALLMQQIVQRIKK